MEYLKIHHENITAATAGILCDICPFSSITYRDGRLYIDSGCRMCGLCVKNGPVGAITLEKAETIGADKDAWRGIAVFIEYQAGAAHPVAWELIGKARELASVTKQPVYGLLIGGKINNELEKALLYGVDELYAYNDPDLAEYRAEPYANVFADFVGAVRPSAVLVGATHIGRSLAPRVAARFRTGITADCTMLEMRTNSDLVQIRPAFGGNIMAQITTPRHRPQFCTVRYKVFASAKPAPGTYNASSTPGALGALGTSGAPGALKRIQPSRDMLRGAIKTLGFETKPALIDISEAKRIVAVGRGLKKKEDLVMAEELAGLLDAQLASTRPLIENGWFDPRRQIGLSGRTVGAELIITIGISGSIQFMAGMRGCGCIIAINQDPGAAIFGIAHYAAIGDLYEVLPELISSCKEASG